MTATAVTVLLPDKNGADLNIGMLKDDATGALYNVIWDPASIAAGTPTAINPYAAVPVKGADAHDAVPANDPFGIAAFAATALGTAVAGGDLTKILGDVYGRLIAMPALREQIAPQFTTISSGSETTIVTAESGIKNDLVNLIISNTHASTDVNVTIKDGTGGTTRLILPALASKPATGFTSNFFLPAAAANTNWTATCSGSATVNILALFVKNK